MLSAPEEAILRLVDYKLEVVCYAVKSLPLTHAVSKLIIPALLDQLTTMRNIVAPSFLVQHPQVGYYLYRFFDVKPFFSLYKNGDLHNTI